VVAIWERESATGPDRARYVSRFEDDGPMAVVSTQSPIVRTVGLRVPLRLVFGVLWLLLAPNSGSVLAASYVAIVRNVLVLLGHAKALRGDRGAYLFRVYRIETPFLAAALREAAVPVSLIQGTTPLFPNVPRVFGDRLVLGTTYQRDEVEFYQRSQPWPPTVVWAPAEAVDMEERYGAQVLPDLPEAIGVYTQGWWLRSRLGIADPDTEDAYVGHERAFLACILGYLDGNPDVRAVVFPHPLERRHWNANSEHGYGLLADHPRVEIDWSGQSSVLSFDRVGLGVTTFSTVGFDRLWMGLRTVFFPEEGSVDGQVPSPYAALFAPDAATFLNLSDKARQMTHAAFMADYFGKAATAAPVSAKEG
jgi:hypothetical protein